MTGLRDLFTVGGDLLKHRRPLWIGPCGTAALLLVSLLLSGRAATVLTAIGAALMGGRFLMSCLVARRSARLIEENARLFREAEDSRQQIEQLFAITDILRQADVVARYGGKELMVILPDCGLDDAVLKAEMLRARIEGLCAIHGTPISASLGMAQSPKQPLARAKWSRWPMARYMPPSRPGVTA